MTISRTPRQLLEKGWNKLAMVHEYFSLSPNYDVRIVKAAVAVPRSLAETNADKDAIRSCRFPNLSNLVAISIDGFLDHALEQRVVLCGWSEGAP